MFIIEENVVSNCCDSYCNEVARYATYEDAEMYLPSDRYETEELDGHVNWWDYKYTIREID